MNKKINGMENFINTENELNITKMSFQSIT